MPTQERIPVILNPSARSEGAGGISEKVAGFSYQVEIHETKGLGDAHDLALDLAHKNHHLIVAAGGDGTVNQVIAGIAKAQAESKGELCPTLGILPLGTMNVFARELGIPTNDPLAAWGVIQSGNQDEIDLWLANGIPFVQMAGVGLDAEIVKRTPWETKKALGTLSYFFAAFSLIGKKLPKLQVEVAGHDKPLEGRSLLLGNGALYGGPAPVFPGANNRDGNLDLLLFRKISLPVLLQLSGAIAANELCDSRHVHYDRSPSFRVTSLGEKEEPFEVDGEVVGTTPVEFAAAPYPLRVATPPNPKPRSFIKVADDHFSS